MFKTNQINYFFEDIKSCKHQLPNKGWIRKCVENEKFSVGWINFVFCSDKYLKRVNKKYLNKTYLTDVITFQTTPPKIITIKNKKNIYGDVFISIERVKENKKTYNTLFAKELQRVMIHGVLHLAGYCDSTKSEKKLMTEKENLYINLLN